MNIKCARLSTKATCGNSFILTEVKPYYAYADGQRVGDPIGYTYTVILPEKKFEKLKVKIEGTCQIESPEDSVAVIFTDLQLEIKWSQSDGNYIAATATDIHLAT